MVILNRTLTPTAGDCWALVGLRRVNADAMGTLDGDIVKSSFFRDEDKSVA